MLAGLPRTVNDLLVVSNAGPHSLRERALRLEALLQALLALIVEEVRGDRQGVRYLAGCVRYLALPTFVGTLDFLDSYVDYLAGEKRPGEGVARELQDLLLTRSFTRPLSRQLMTLGGSDELTTVTSSISLLRLARALLPLLMGARPDRHAEVRTDVPSVCIGAYDDIASGLGPFGALRFVRVADAKPAERRIRLTLVPLGGSLAQASSALVTWDPPPRVDDLALMGPPLPAPSRLTPRWMFLDDALFMLAARRTSWIYRPLTSSEGPAPKPDPDELAPWAFPMPVDNDDLPTWMEEEASRTGGVSIACDDSVRSELMQDDLTSGRMLSDRFRLDREISHARASAVFEGHDMDTGHAVILKIHFPHEGEDRDVQIEGFAREAEILSSIDHPSVTSLVYNGCRESPSFLALDPFEGASLRHLMVRGIPTVIARAEPIMKGLAAGLAAIHRAAIVHRDIKPENILVAADDAVQLIDFGLARTGAGEGIILDDVGGTLPYMSSEAIAGTRIGPFTDVFAMGCLYYELLTGKTLFGARTAREVEERVGRGERGPVELIQDPRRAPLYALIVAATTVDPAKRIKDGAMLERMLAAALRGENPGKAQGGPDRGGFFSRLLGRRT